MDEDRDKLGTGGGQVASALGDFLRVAVGRARGEVDKAAHQGRILLELRQLKRDRTVMYSKLGREVRALVEGGELDHPGLHRGLARIDALDKTIEEVEARVSAMGGEGEQDHGSSLAPDEETR